MTIKDAAMDAEGKGIVEFWTDPAVFKAFRDTLVFGAGFCRVVIEADGTVKCEYVNPKDIVAEPKA